MSTALAVYHGRFGRVTLYLLDREMTTHAHREGHLAFHVDGNVAAMPVRGELLPLAPDSGVAVSPWEPHGYRPATIAGPDGIVQCDATLCLVLYIKPGWFLEMSRSAHAGLRFGRSVVDATAQIKALVRRITAFLLDGEETDRIDGYLFELTQESFDQSWQWSPGEAPCLTRQMGFSDFRVRRSMRLIGEKVGSSELLLDEVARDSGLSRAHFYKLFRKQTGITPNLFLNTLRMERAIEGLTRTSQSVTDIGFDLGFASQASFTRFFSSNVGIPPTDYRRIAHVGHA